MRLVRHLTFSNVIAVIALFLALGGAAYAGSKLNGKNIVNGSIGGGKLRNETITANKIKKGTITSAQIAPGSITSNTINLTTLATVPSAQSATTATTAQSATTANTATTAKTADTATSASSATKADTATTAGTATNADSAKHADSADSAGHANTADTATDATHADTATEAEMLEGATRAELTVSCGAGTEPYGGMCWDETTRPARFWLAAVKECGDEEGRLPSIDELIAFVLREGTQVTFQTWSGDLADVSGGTEEVLTSNETVRSKVSGVQLGYRCVFPLTN
jgi:hypothetical protein